MIRLENVTVAAGRFRLDGISLHIPKGYYGVLMGPTGSGKTTLLETICGLRQVETGQVVVDNNDVTALRPGRRGIGYVPQDAALFRTMTVRQNLDFALRVRKWPRDACSRRLDELAGLLGLTGLLDRKPQGLSGGEAQRVALGRALSAHPPVLCLDEPLSSLDEPTRADFCGLLAKVKEETGVTVLHVTHDRNEAARLADILVTIDGGSVVEKAGWSGQREI